MWREESEGRVCMWREESEGRDVCGGDDDIEMMLMVSFS